MIYKGFSPPAESQNDSLIVSCHSLHLKLKKIKHIDRLENIEMNLWAYMDWTQNCQRLYYSIKSLCHASNNIKSWNLFYWMNFSNRKKMNQFLHMNISWELELLNPSLSLSSDSQSLSLLSGSSDSSNNVDSNLIYFCIIHFCIIYE